MHSADGTVQIAYGTSASTPLPLSHMLLTRKTANTEPIPYLFQNRESYRVKTNYSSLSYSLNFRLIFGVEVFFFAL